MLINDRTIKEINLISQQCFWLNRVLDRAVSVLDSDFGMVHTSAILHEGLAHKYPILADEINKSLSMFGEKISYLETPEDSRDYDDIVSIFQTILDENILLYEALKKCLLVVREVSDFNVEYIVLEFIGEVNKYVAQAITLRDKAVSLKDNVEMYEILIDKIFTLS